MSPARESGNERDQIKQKLSDEVRSAEDLYRTRNQQYVKVTDGLRAKPDDPTTVQEMYSAAREVRMARKRYRRATRLLAGFTASMEA